MIVRLLRNHWIAARHLILSLTHENPLPRLSRPQKPSLQQWGTEMRLCSSLERIISILPRVFHQLPLSNSKESAAVLLAIEDPTVLLAICALGELYRRKVRPAIAFIEEKDTHLKLPQTSTFDPGGNLVARYSLPATHRAHQRAVEVFYHTWHAACLARYPEEYLPDLTEYIITHSALIEIHTFWAKLKTALQAGLKSHLDHYPAVAFGPPDVVGWILEEEWALALIRAMRKLLPTINSPPHQNIFIPTTQPPLEHFTLDPSDAELFSILSTAAAAVTPVPPPKIPTLREMLFSKLAQAPLPPSNTFPQPKIPSLQEMALTILLRKVQQAHFENNYQMCRVFTNTYYAFELYALESGHAFHVAKQCNVHVLGLLPKLRQYFEHYIFAREVSNQGEEGVFRQQDLEKMGRESLGREQVNAALLTRTLKNQGVDIPVTEDDIRMYRKKKNQHEQ